jgi:UDP-N-acetyl-2-amino-2-deoxyglucuronate dehydrogenase
VLDQLLDLTGPAASVCGYHATSPGRGIDTEDVAVGALRWQGGALGTLDCTTMSYPGTPDRIELACTAGSALLERYRVRVLLRDGTVLEEVESGGGDARPGGRDYLAHTRIIADMLDALDEGRAPLADGSSALHVHRLIDALLRSNGTEVRL